MNNKLEKAVVSKESYCGAMILSKTYECSSSLFYCIFALLSGNNMRIICNIDEAQREGSELVTEIQLNLNL